MKTKSTRPDYIYVTYINTTPQKLWRALIEPKLIPQYWFGCTNTSTWQRGDAIESHDPEGGCDWRGKIVENRPPHRLAYTFQHVGRNKPVSYVTFDVEPPKKGSVLQSAGVKLTVTHRGYAPGSQDFKGISCGWPVILSALKSLLETGRATFKSK